VNLDLHCMSEEEEEMFEIKPYEEMIAMTLEEDLPQIKEIKRDLEHYKRVGLEGQIVELQLRVLATVLESRGMFLFTVNERSGYSNYKLEIIHPNGKRKAFGPSKNNYYNFGRESLSDFRGQIPPSILEKLPEGAGYQATIFYEADFYEPHPFRKGDPIIAVLVDDFYDPTYLLYIGVLKWHPSKRIK